MARLNAEARAQAGFRTRLEDDLQHEKDRARQAEANMQNLVQEMTAWQRKATEAQTRNGVLEGRLAGGTALYPQGLAFGAVEAFLDASGTLSGWLSMLGMERGEVAIACYTFDLSEVVSACIGVRRRNPASPARIRILADEGHTESMKGTGQEFARAS